MLTTHYIMLIMYKITDTARSLISGLLTNFLRELLREGRDADGDSTQQRIGEGGAWKIYNFFIYSTLFIMIFLNFSCTSRSFDLPLKVAQNSVYLLINLFAWCLFVVGSLVSTGQLRWGKGETAIQNFITPVKYANMVRVLVHVCGIEKNVAKESECIEWVRFLDAVQ